LLFSPECLEFVGDNLLSLFPRDGLEHARVISGKRLAYAIWIIQTLERSLATSA
jgi:hypothetical protein